MCTVTLITDDGPFVAFTCTVLTRCLSLFGHVACEPNTCQVPARNYLTRPYATWMKKITKNVISFDMGLYDARYAAPQN